MQKFGLNIHAQNLKDRNRLLDYLKRNKPQVVLVLDDENFASQIADLGIPNVILRVTINDNSIHNKISSFREWWNLVKPKYRDKRLIVHFCNEPKSNLKRLNDMCVEGMAILHAEGYRGVFGNFAVGNPEPQEWQNELKGMLQAIVAYNGKFFLGLHEYFMYDPALCSPYEIGRYKVLPANIPIIFTEFGSDYIQDIYDHTAPKQSIAGWKSHLAYFTSVYSNPAKDVYVHFCKNIFDSFYNRDNNVLGVCFFSYGDSGGWSDYDLEDCPFIEDFKVLEMADTANINQPMSISSTFEEGTNRRTAPVNGAVKGQVTTPVNVIKLKVEGQWNQYRFTDGDYWCFAPYIIEAPINKNGLIKIELYNAPNEDVERANALAQELLTLLKKYNAEVVE